MLERTTTLYRDKAYGFTLQLPSWWDEYIVTDTTIYDPASEYELHFDFKYRGKVYTDVLNITVFHMTREQWEKEGFNDSPYILLGERHGRLFAYSTPEELPDEFLNPKTGKYNYSRYGKAIKLLKRMVNIDVPQIVRTFRFLAVQPVTTKPYLSNVVTRCVENCRTTRK